MSSDHEKTMRSLDFWGNVMTVVVVVLCLPVAGLFLRFIFWPMCVAAFTGDCGGKPCQP